MGGRARQAGGRVQDQGPLLSRPAVGYGCNPLVCSQPLTFCYVAVVPSFNAGSMNTIGTCTSCIQALPGRMLAGTFRRPRLSFFLDISVLFLETEDRDSSHLRDLGLCPHSDLGAFPTLKPLPPRQQVQSGAGAWPGVSGLSSHRALG